MQPRIAELLLESSAADTQAGSDYAADRRRGDHRGWRDRAGIAFGLSKLGYKTVNVDSLPAAGCGPTSNSCAIVRFYYSSWDGVAMAYEGVFHWLAWSEYIGIAVELESRAMSTRELSD